jgi:hypothetical protein
VQKLALGLYKKSELNTAEAIDQENEAIENQEKQKKFEPYALTGGTLGNYWPKSLFLYKKQIKMV